MTFSWGNLWLPRRSPKNIWECVFWNHQQYESLEIPFKGVLGLPTAFGIEHRVSTGKAIASSGNGPVVGFHRCVGFSAFKLLGSRAHPIGF